VCRKMAPEERPSASLSGTIKVFLFDLALVISQMEAAGRERLCRLTIQE
jgi:hypothetical protein